MTHSRPLVKTATDAQSTQSALTCPPSHSLTSDLERRAEKGTKPTTCQQYLTCIDAETSCMSSNGRRSLRNIFDSLQTLPHRSRNPHLLRSERISHRQLRTFLLAAHRLYSWTRHAIVLLVARSSGCSELYSTFPRGEWTRSNSCSSAEDACMFPLFSQRRSSITSFPRKCVPQRAQRSCGKDLRMQATTSVGA